MAGHFNAVGDMNFLKNSFTQNLNAGEKLMGFEYKMTIEEYPELSVLVRSVQIPALGRTQVEDFGSHGLKFVQQGAVENSGEIVVTAVEVLTGSVIAAIRKIVKNKEYVTISIEASPESTQGKSAEPLKFKLLHCFIRSDAIDLSSEDTAALVKPSMNIQYNWIDM